MKFEELKQGSSVRYVGSPFPSLDLSRPGIVDMVDTGDHSAHIKFGEDMGLWFFAHGVHSLMLSELEPWEPGSVPPGKPVAADLVAANEWRFTCATCGVKNRTEASHVGHGCSDKRTEEAKLADDLCEQMHPFVGEGEAARLGEGAVQCLQRLLCELRDRRGECHTLRIRVQRLERSLDLAQARLAKRR